MRFLPLLVFALVVSAAAEHNTHSFRRLAFGRSQATTHAVQRTTEPIMGTLLTVLAVTKGVSWAVKGVASLVHDAKNKQLTFKLEAQRKSLCMLLLSHCEVALETQNRLVTMIRSKHPVDENVEKSMRRGVRTLIDDIHLIIPEMCRQIEKERVEKVEMSLKRLSELAKAHQETAEEMAAFAQQLHSEEVGTGNIVVNVAKKVLDAVGSEVSEQLAEADAVVGTALTFRKLGVQINGYVNEAYRMQQEHDESVADLEFFTCRALLSIAESNGQFPLDETVLKLADASQRTQYYDEVLIWAKSFLDLIDSFTIMECPKLTAINAQDFYLVLNSKLKNKQISPRTNLFKAWMETRKAIMHVTVAPETVKEIKVVQLSDTPPQLPRFSPAKLLTTDGKFVALPEEDRQTIGANLFVRKSGFDIYPAYHPITSIAVLRKEYKLCSKDEEGPKITQSSHLGVLAEQEIKEHPKSAARRKELMEQGFNIEDEAIVFNSLKKSNGECEEVHLVWKRVPAGLPITDVFIIENPGTRASGLTKAEEDVIEKQQEGYIAFARQTYNLRLLNAFFESFRDEFYIGFQKHTYLYWDGERVVSAGETAPKPSKAKVALDQKVEKAAQAAVDAVKGLGPTMSSPITHRLLTDLIGRIGKSPQQQRNVLAERLTDKLVDLSHEYEPEPKPTGHRHKEPSKNKQ